MLVSEFSGKKNLQKTQIRINRKKEDSLGKNTQEYL